MTEASSEPIHPLEKGDVLRKVQRTGVASLTVSLPKWWVELVGVHHGDTLRFHDLGNGRLELCIEGTAAHPSRPHERGLSVDARDAAPHLVPRLIVGAYVTGQDQVTLSGHLTPLDREEINQAIAKLLGASIVEDGPDQVVIQTFIDPARYSIARLLDRLVHLLLEQVEECRRGALGTGTSGRSQLVALEDEMDKIYRLTVRQLMLACGHDDVAKEIGASHHHSHMGFRMIAKLLEDLGDHLFALGQNLFPEEGERWNVPGVVAKEVALRLERFGTLLRRTVTAFESSSAEAANLVLNDVHSDVPVLMALTRNLPGRVSSQPDSLAVGRVLEYLLSLTQMLNVMNEVTINQAVDLEEPSQHDARFSRYSVEPLPGG
jgi:phosphate uptake regulator